MDMMRYGGSPFGDLKLSPTTTSPLAYYDFSVNIQIRCSLYAALSLMPATVHKCKRAA